MISDYISFNGVVNGKEGDEEDGERYRRGVGRRVERVVVFDVQRK